MKYHVALMNITTGTPFACPANTFNDLPLEEQLRLHESCAKEADEYRKRSISPEAPVFLVAPEYTYCAHPRNSLGNVMKRFLQNDSKKQIMTRVSDISARYPKVALIFSVAWLKANESSQSSAEGRNTTYVFYDGSKILSQHKNGDAGELLPGDVADGVRFREPGAGDSTSRRPESGADGVFLVEGKSYGIETCCDFGCRLPVSLGKTDSLFTKKSSLEGQFLISSTIDHTAAAKTSLQNGVDVFHSDYFFHADGRQDLWPSSLWGRDHFSKNVMGGYRVRRNFVNSASTVPLTPIAITTGATVPLSCYSVPVGLAAGASSSSSAVLSRTAEPVPPPPPSLAVRLSVGLWNWWQGFSRGI